jgi:hypothetical protein
MKKRLEYESDQFAKSAPREKSFKSKRKQSSSGTDN